MHGVRLVRDGLTYVALIALATVPVLAVTRTAILNGISCPPG